MSAAGRLLLLLAIAGCFSSAHPSTGRLAWFIPDYARLQFAGSQGMFSLGPGRTFFTDRLEPEFDYGFVPAQQGGRDIHIISQKTTLLPFRFGIRDRTILRPLLLGYSASFALGDNYIVVLPSEYRDYYWPSGLHIWIFAGTRIDREFASSSWLKGMGAIAEVGAIESYWTAYLDNRYVKLTDILSLALALRFSFGPP